MSTARKNGVIVFVVVMLSAPLAVLLWSLMDPLIRPDIQVWVTGVLNHHIYQDGLKLESEKAVMT